jgi:hypothetical protein
MRNIFMVSVIPHEDQNALSVQQLFSAPSGPNKNKHFEI